MVHRVVNCEEFIGKTVGRRLAPDGLRVRPNDIENAKKMQAAFGGIRVPRGVYRFHTHTAANEWLMDHLTRPRK